MLNLGGLAFAAPWALAGFIVVPALWWLLRVTPPAPAVMRFPAVRLLLGLTPTEETPARTPLWLILMRMALAALLILALAHPLIDPSGTLPGSGPLLIAVDNGWAAGRDWSARQRLMADLISRAEREGRQLALLPTAADPTVQGLSLMRPADARAAAAALRPKPWPSDRVAATRRLDALPIRRATVWWLSDGLDGAGRAAEFTRGLLRLGPTTVVLPQPESAALLVAPGPAEAADLTASVLRSGAGLEQTRHVRVVDEEGRLLAEADARFPAGAVRTDVAFKMPVELRNRAARVEVTSVAGAGGVLLLDESARRRPVGIATDRPAGSQQPLLSSTYYIERALQPFADLRRDPASTLVQSGVSMIVLPEGDPGPADSRSALAAWVEKGGVLVRFAGPTLGEDDDLLPVALRQGDRTIGGSMSWERPAHLAEFPAASPFAGLPVPPDVTVDRQVLAEPSADLPSKTWARLTDGTPLVTGAKRGRGWLVLVHTSANTSWSNLAISGLFVDMLRRLDRLGEGTATPGSGVLKPWQVLDGFGRLVPAPVSVSPVQASALARTPVGPEHPPGFYGTEEAHSALNLAPSAGPLDPIRDLPGGAVPEGYAPAPELDLRPALLAAAFCLMLLDILIGYWLRGILRFRLGGGAMAAGLGALVCLCGTARADTPDAYTIEATSELRLAYVKTGVEAVDRISRDGLAGLGAILDRRTAVETGEPMAVDVERDELIFFPLIYWPVTAGQPPLSPEAAARVNKYIETGGTVLFDTQDQGTSVPSDAAANETATRLRALLKGVHIPPLTQIPPDHVLTKSFYLLQDFPGRWLGGTLWVEPAEDRVNDGVSTVIIGSNDWAAAWAVDAQGFPQFPVVPGGEPQREMAYRFGVNVVMYALTGNYKADQVHVPAILERLGQ